MQVGYVVLYVNDVETCRRFWTEQIHMVEKRRSEAGEFTIVQVGFADQPFAFELVPLELMKDNPDGLDLATPSIAVSLSARRQASRSPSSAALCATSCSVSTRRMRTFSCPGSTPRGCDRHLRRTGGWRTSSSPTGSLASGSTPATPRSGS